MTDFLTAGLNEQQLQAVQKTDGPLLLVAGAGSGKTKTLLCRLACLAVHGGVAPEKLLAITFTAKAAQEMRQRAGALCRQAADLSGMWVGTTHALCYDILREHGGRSGPDGRLPLASPSERAAVIKSIAGTLRDNDLSDSLKKHALRITREKNALEGYASMSPLCRAYQQALEEQGLIDFDDLILKALELFENNPRIAEDLRSRFSHISVDEYQDINVPQYRLIKMLCPGRSPNLCAVGDADQAIYAFRGARIENFFNFQRDFPDAAILHLEKNYRSTATIIKASQAVIAKNSNRFAKQLLPTRPPGEAIEILEFADDRDEAAFIAREVEGLLGGMRFETLGRDNSGHALGFGDIAVLYRLHQQGRIIKKSLQKRGIPVEVAASRSLYEEPDIKPVMDLLHAAAEPDSSSAFARLLREKSGSVTLDTLIKEIWDAVHSEGDEKSDVYFELLTSSLVFCHVPASLGLPLFLNNVSLLQEGEIFTPDREAVMLMTAHGAKGLEFPVVFIAGLEEGLFPYQRQSSEGEEQDSEEERRLFYVAMTRAREKLYLLHAKSRFFFGKRRDNAPSTFLFDIPDAVSIKREKKKLQKKKDKPKQMKLFVK